MKNFVLLLVSVFCGASLFGGEWYVDGFTGLNFVEIQSEEDAELESETGYVVGGSFGYKTSAFMRVEGEFAYRENDLKGMSFENEHHVSVTVPMEGSIRQFSAMGNMLFDISCMGYFTPFFGGGIGYRYTEHLDNAVFVGEDASVKIPLEIGAIEGLGYQGIAGLNFQPIQNARMACEYRFVGGVTELSRNHTLAVRVQFFF